MRFRLGQQDQARLGCPDVIEYQPSKIMVNDLIELPVQTGYTVGALATALQDFGRHSEQSLSTRTDVDWGALKAMVWIALRHIGVDLPYAELNFDVTQWRIEQTAASEPAGKAEDASPATSTPT